MLNFLSGYRVIIVCLLLLASKVSLALEFPLPTGNNEIIGRIQAVTLKHNEDLHSIGRRYDIGFYEMVEANRSLAFTGKIKKNTQVIIPGRFVLPPGREGIIINIAEMRLYYYPPDAHKVITHPIGIGRLGWSTPLGEMSIIEKKEKPTWVVPQSIKEYGKSLGKSLPDVVLPGPNNPLGEFALRLSKPTYLLHGTNSPSGVGMRSSSGCIRLFPEDIRTFFPLISIGTKVSIINQPYKVGWQHNYLFLEAHQPLQEDKEQHHGLHNLTPMVSAILAAEKDYSVEVNWKLAENIGETQQGMPIAIGIKNIADHQEPIAH